MPRNNPTAPITKLTLNHVEYDLLFDFEAVAEAEEVTGRALLTGLRSRDILAPPISLVRAMLYACLRSRQPETTFPQVKNMVDRQNIAEVWGRTMEAWTQSLPEAPLEGEDSADPNPSQS